MATNFSIYYFSSHFFNVKIEKFVAVFHISGVWHVGWWNLITSVHYQFHSTELFFISFCLYRAFFTHLISSNLSCNLCLWYYDQLVHFNKEINALNVYCHSLWEYSKCFHCSFEWHLTPHVTLSIETCIRQTPCINRTLQHSPRVSA